MNYKVWIALYCIFAASLIYWDITRHDTLEINPISKCHYAEILIYYNKPMCTECKLFCEVIDGQRKLKEKK